MNKKIIYTLLIGTLTFGSISPTFAAIGFPDYVKSLEEKARLRLHKLKSKMNIIATQEKQIKELNVNLVAKNDKLDGMHRIINIQNEQINSQSEKIKDISITASTQSGQFKFLNDKIQEMNATITSQNEKINSQSDKIKVMNVIIATQSDQINSSSDKMKEMSSIIDTQSGQLKSQTEKVKGLNDTIKQLQATNDLGTGFAQLAQQLEATGHDAEKVLSGSPIFAQYIANKSSAEFANLINEYHKCKNSTISTNWLETENPSETQEDIANQLEAEQQFKECMNDVEAILQEKAREYLAL